jgi:hypothetical protein
MLTVCAHFEIGKRWLIVIAAAQISIVQNLTYFEHLSEPMAEFLHILAEQYDYPQLADEIMRELSNKEFNSNDTKGPKSVSTFFTKFSELAPRLVIKQMTMIAKQLDSEVSFKIQFYLPPWTYNNPLRHTLSAAL